MLDNLVALAEKYTMITSCYPFNRHLFAFQRIREVGRAFRQHYVNRLKFLKGTPDPTSVEGIPIPSPSEGELWIRSTDSERTIETAWEFTQGLFDRSREDEPVLTTVNVVEPETMYPNSCPQLSATLRLHKSTLPAFGENKKRVKDHFEQSDMTPEDKKYFQRRSVSGLCNTITILKEHGHTLPPVRQHYPKVAINPDTLAFLGNN